MQKIFPLPGAGSLGHSKRHRRDYLEMVSERILWDDELSAEIHGTYPEQSAVAVGSDVVRGFYYHDYYLEEHPVRSDHPAGRPSGDPEGSV